MPNLKESMVGKHLSSGGVNFQSLDMERVGTTETHLRFAAMELRRKNFVVFSKRSGENTSLPTDFDTGWRKSFVVHSKRSGEWI